MSRISSNDGRQRTYRNQNPLAKRQVRREKEVGKNGTKQGTTRRGRKKEPVALGQQEDNTMLIEMGVKTAANDANKRQGSVGVL